MGNHLLSRPQTWVVLVIAAACLLILLEVGCTRAGEPGEKIMASRCIQCHDLPDPSMLTDEQWVVVLETMAANAELSSKEKSAVLDYLTSHEKMAVVVASMVSEKQLLESRCSHCHTTDRVLMMDLTHESSSHIVMRMQERAPDLISDSDVRAIVEYLDRGAPESGRREHNPVNGGPAEVFRERCTACHTAERVYLALQEGEKKGTAVVWAHIVNRMRKKAPQWITDGESQQILQYLDKLRADADD